MAVSDGPLPRKRLHWKPTTPAATLVLLSPLIGEVLNGATRLSFILVYLPEVMVWGCGTLLIREVVHRWRGGWPSVTLLGLSLSVFVEVLVLQTSVAPLPWLQLASIPVHDRVWGVNWLWFAFMLGYETVWIVLVPILIVELIFPQQRREAWLRPGRLAVTSVVFIVGSLGLWALWTQTAIPNAFHIPKYWPPPSTLLVGALLAVLLIVGAYAVRHKSMGHAPDARSVPPPWVVGLVSALLACAWWILIVWIFVPNPPAPFWVPLMLAPIWAVVAYFIIARWSAASSWNDRYRWTLAFAALVICMLMGYLGSSLWPAIDLVFKIALNMVAFAWMISLGRVVWRR
jgi:hypothetical protein